MQVYYLSIIKNYICLRKLQDIVGALHDHCFSLNTAALLHSQSFHLQIQHLLLPHMTLTDEGHSFQAPSGDLHPALAVGLSVC